MFVSKALIAFMLCFSGFLFLIPIGVSFSYFIKTHFGKSKTVTTINNRLGIYIACWLFTVVLLRISVYYYSDLTGMNFFEIVITGFLQAIRTMALDETYELVLASGKQMLIDLFDAGKFSIILYGGFSTIMNMLTPIAGGAYIFNLLTGFFPKLRVRLSFWRDHYYFSELNECSVALAKSIVLKKYGILQRPVLVFTDIYIDEHNENDNELYQEAKRLGAVCLSDDLVHLNIWTLKDKVIYLIDSNEADNIQSLSAIADESNLKQLKKTEIYVFYQDDSYAMTELKIVDRLEKRIFDEYRKKINRAFDEIYKTNLQKIDRTKLDEKEYNNKLKDAYQISFFEAVSAEEPKIVRVRSYEYLIFLLHRDIPLFTPLINREEDDSSEFNLTILGAGKIGTQMMLSSTWAGQFYGNKMAINMIGDESVSDFRNRLQTRYPEIMETTKSGSSILKIFDDASAFAPEYFALRYAQSDVLRTSFDSVNCNNIVRQNENFNILESDYFFISLGSDESNISVAEELIRKIILHRVTANKDIVIVMIIYDSKLCSLFNERGLSYLFENFAADNGFIYEDNMKHITLKAYGSCDFIYDHENISILKYNSLALAMKNCEVNYDNNEQINKSSLDRKKNLYNYWSTLARNFFINYRIYSAYRFLKQHEPDNVLCNKKLEFNSETYINYYRAAVDETSRNEGLNNCLSWLEHRRWNAYLRSIGFSYNNEKHIELKVHNCLVELQNKPVCSEYTKKFNVKASETERCKKCKFNSTCEARYAVTSNSGDVIHKDDLLDNVSKVKNTDYKLYDNPDDYDKELAEIFKLK